MHARHEIIQDRGEAAALILDQQEALQPHLSHGPWQEKPGPARLQDPDLALILSDTRPPLKFGRVCHVFQQEKMKR